MTRFVAGTCESGETPPANAIRGFHSATFTEEAYQKTAAFLVGVLESQRLMRGKQPSWY